MSKAERLKEEIGWLKVVFAVCVALDASLIAWLAQNYTTANPVIVATGCIASILLALLVVFVNRRAYCRLEELEDT